MLTKIGFVLEHLGPSQLPYQLIRSINSYYQEKDDVDVILYWRNVAPFVVTPLCASMNLFEAFRSDSPLIATDLNSASRILQYFTLDRYYYLMDLEWCHMPSKNYEQLAEIYQNPKLKIIARSEQHKNIFELTWNRKVEGIVPDANIKGFLELINGVKNEQH